MKLLQKKKSFQICVNHEVLATEREPEGPAQRAQQSVCKNTAWQHSFKSLREKSNKNLLENLRAFGQK